MLNKINRRKWKECKTTQKMNYNTLCRVNKNDTRYYTFRKEATFVRRKYVVPKGVQLFLSCCSNIRQITSKSFQNGFMISLQLLK